MQQIKDLTLSLQQLSLLLWHRFDLWLGNFHLLWLWQKKKGGGDLLCCHFISWQEA